MRGMGGRQQQLRPPVRVTTRRQQLQCMRVWRSQRVRVSVWGAGWRAGWVCFGGRVGGRVGGVRSAWGGSLRGVLGGDVEGVTRGEGVLGVEVADEC